MRLLLQQLEENFEKVDDNLWFTKQDDNQKEAKTITSMLRVLNLGHLEQDLILAHKANLLNVTIDNRALVVGVVGKVK